MNIGLRVFHVVRQLHVPLHPLLGGMLLVTIRASELVYGRIAMILHWLANVSFQVHAPLVDLATFAAVWLDFLNER